MFTLPLCSDVYTYPRRAGMPAGVVLYEWGQGEWCSGWSLCFASFASLNINGIPAGRNIDCFSTLLLLPVHSLI